MSLHHSPDTILACTAPRYDEAAVQAEKARRKSCVRRGALLLHTAVRCAVQWDGGLLVRLV